MEGVRKFLHAATLAATHRLKREFEAIHMEEGENPLVFLGRVDKAADELAVGL